jgi:hypothetical protein
MNRKKQGKVKLPIQSSKSKPATCAKTHKLRNSKRWQGAKMEDQAVGERPFRKVPKGGSLRN